MGWYGRYGGYDGYPEYVSVAERQRRAAKELAKLAKSGRVITPVKLEGRHIATTFWGKAWNENLERYSDYENRLPKGKTYVRNGSVVDLQIKAGKVTAVVSGSELYEVEIDIEPLAAKIWKQLKADCGGKIGTLVELLQGKLAQGVMELVTRKDGGLFPKPAEIDMSCSCPDGAYMCKHLAAVLYGVGARLDLQPELLFMLRKVDHLELISEAAVPAIAGKAKAGANTIADADLADVFGIELDVPAATTPVEVSKRQGDATPAKAVSRRKKTPAARLARKGVVAAVRKVKEIEPKAGRKLRRAT